MRETEWKTHISHSMNMYERAMFYLPESEILWNVS